MRSLLFALPLVAACAAADDREFWLETCARHGFSPAETAAALGLLESEAAEGLLGRPAAPAAPFSLLPYPGGRHPRIGFLEGAVDPRRETKFSLFLPGGGYAVVDFPEAVWADGELVYLAHRHLPTTWEKRGVVLPPMEWTRRVDGGLEARRVLPDGVSFHATALPSDRGVDLELTLRNGSSTPMRGVRSQVCVMLKGAPGFEAQTQDNKVLLKEARTAAVRSADGSRWIGTVFEDGRTWQNPPCPCIHSDPVFPDLAPGAEATRRGRVFAYEGADFEAEVARREAAGTLRPR